MSEPLRATPLVRETDRLRLRELTEDDAEFVLRLVNDPAWLRFIGDRGIRDLDGARGYVRDGPQRMYQQFGFGLWLVERKDDGAPMGMCGLIKRDTLDDVDIGFALLPEFRRSGYCFEAAAATMRHAQEVLGLPRVVAITSHDNVASGALLERLGFAFERMIPRVPDGESLRLYGISLQEKASMHRSRLAAIVIDTQTDDIGPATAFWSQALGAKVLPAPASWNGKYDHLETPPGEPQVLVQKVEHPSRVHIDIETDDIQAEVKRLEGLGARVVQVLPRWTVMEAPTGHRFCVVNPQRPDFATAPGVNTWG